MKKRFAVPVLLALSLAMTASFWIEESHAWCSECSSFPGWSELGGPMGDPPNSCYGCVKASGGTITANRQLVNSVDSSGNLQFKGIFTTGTTQNIWFISDCYSGVYPNWIKKCVQDSPRVVASAGTVNYPGSPYPFTFSNQRIDAYGNSVYGELTLAPGGSYEHKVEKAVLAQICEYPNPSIIHNELPYSPVNNPFTTPSSPIPQSNPMPSPVVQNPKPQEALCPKAQCGVGDPVNTYDGNYTYDEVDLRIHGLMPVAIERRYTSGLNSFIGEFGVGAHLATYNYKLTSVPKNGSNVVTLAPNQQVVLDVGNGTTLTFTNPDGTNKFINNGLLGTAGNVLRLTLDGTNHYLGAVYTEVDGKRHIFDANSLQTSIQDRNSNEILLTRNGSGQLTQVKDVVSGHYITISYNADGTISQTTSDTSRTYQYGYSGAKELTSVTQPNYSQKTYIWDAQHQIKVAKDYLSQMRAGNVYSSTGAVMTQTAGDNGIITLEYVDSNTRKSIDNDGNVTTYTYNNDGVLTQIKDPLNHTQTITYSPNFFTNNTASRYYEVTNALSQTTRYDINAQNLPTLITDANNKTTTITYDTTLLDKVKTITDPMGHTTTYGYDANGNLTTITDNAGKQTILTYNSYGQLLTVKNALNKTTTYAYNTNHQLQSTTDPLNHSSSYTYNSNGLLSTVTDPNNNVTTYNYDTLENINTIVDAQNNTFTFNFNSNGDLTSAFNARNNGFYLNRDAKGRVYQKYMYPSYYQNYFRYDSNDNLLSFTDAKGQMTSYTYDAANRLTKALDYSGTTYTYGYDNANRLTSVGDGTNTWSTTYDVLGRPNVVTAPGGSLDYDFNDDSLLTQLSSGTYGTVTYGYDSRDRLTSITKGSNTYGYGYNDIGLRTSLTRPSSLNTSYTYDDAARLTGIQYSQSSTTVDSLTYDYDNAGNILKETQSNGPFGPIVREYSYDTLNRLGKIWAMGLLPGSTFSTPGDQTAAIQDVNDAIATINETTRRNKLTHAVSLGGVVPENASWTYDVDNNIASKTNKNFAGGSDATTTNTYDSDDRLSSATTGATTTNYTYDSNGSLTSDGTRTFTWNAQNQLRQLNMGATTYQFEYDPFGRRKSWTDGTTTKNYWYNNLNVLSDGASTFLNGSGIDEPLQLTNGSNVRSHLQDIRGSVSRLVSASSGAAVSQNFYTAYGKLENNASNPAPNPFTYTAREDDGNGLMYYRARYYDPKLEMFISQDPLGDAQRYAQGNPAFYVDPMGTLVVATYSLSGHQLSVLDIDTNQTAISPATSGGNGSPIPTGQYEILEGNPNSGPDFFRLDPIDSNPRDYIDNSSGRFGFNLHRPGRLNYGCIAGQNMQDWQRVRDFIRRTSADYVGDKFHSIEVKPFPFLLPNPKPYSPSPIKRYGYLQVVP